MFWKIVKKNYKNRRFFSRPAKWSIIWQLTFIYTIAASCVFLAATLFLYWSFTSQLEHENYQTLKNETLILQKILQTHSLSSPILQEEITEESPLERNYSRIIDNISGKIIVETPGMVDKVPVSAFAKMIPSEQKPYITSYFYAPKQKHEKKKNYLLMITPVSNTLTDKAISDSTILKRPQNLFIQMALDITEQQKVIEDYKEDLFIGLLIGIIGSALVGILVTRKGIKPLREITRSTQRMTVSRLQERLNPESWPRELSQLATAFNEMLNRIEEGFTRLSQFSSDLAHEFRTPIATLMGEAEITLSKPRTNEEYREVLESSLEEFNRLTHTIENLLFLAGAENPGTAIQRSLVNVREIMDNIRDFYTIVAEEKNIKITCQGDTRVMAEPLMLRRALANLVSNALRYTSPGGTITLTTEYHDNNVSLSISDDGEGIASEHLPYLCNRFYRVDPARNHRTGGTGLGLAIVKTIMDLHQGKIVIDSQLNRGTVVTLIITKL